MKVRTIAVIGAGARGRALALAAVRAGYEVVLEDALPETQREALEWIARTLEESTGGATSSGADRVAALRRIRTAGSVEDACRDADFILETLPEEFELKLEIFTMLDKFARPHAVMASHTASFPIDELAEMTYRPELCAGMRFAGTGADLGGKATVVRGAKTSAATIAACRELALRMGCTVEIAHENAHENAGQDPARAPAGPAKAT